jgi:hypothetical protein
MQTDEKKIEEAVKEAASLFTEQNVNNPGPAEHLLIYNAMLKGWELGIHQAIAYMKEKGIHLENK